jgi:hypothetical protein
MGITILLSTLLPIVIVVFVLVTVFGGMKREQEATQRLLATGMPADGRVLMLAATGQSVAVMGVRSIRVMIGLEVTLPGRPPYQVQISPLVSELLIASIQPGAYVSLRVDPHNPMNVAIAAGGPAAQPMGYAAQPGMGMQQPGMGMQPMGMGMQPMGLAPGLAPQQFQRGSRFALIMVLITTVPVGLILAYTFIDFSAFGLGGSDAPSGGWCKAATECCKVVFGSDTSSCDNYKDGMPVEGCKMAYRGYKDSAKATGKSCK